METKKIDWKKEFSIGNSSIDHDHSKILDIYNRIVDLLVMKNANHGEECAKLLTEMTDYALYHFKREENYMSEFSYPKFKEHRHYHMDYLYKVSLYNLKYIEAASFDSEMLLKFLKSWWTDHIQKVDREYEDYKNQVHSDARY